MHDANTAKSDERWAVLCKGYNTEKSPNQKTYLHFNEKHFCLILFQVTKTGSNKFSLLILMFPCLIFIVSKFLAQDNDFPAF